MPKSVQRHRGFGPRCRLCAGLLLVLSFMLLVSLNLELDQSIGPTLAASYVNASSFPSGTPSNAILWYTAPADTQPVGCRSQELAAAADGPFPLGGRVWYDTNQDGIQDEEEPGVSGIKGDLYGSATCTGAVVATRTSGVDGAYQFEALPAGNYCLRFYHLPVGWYFSPKDRGDDDSVDSDVDPVTGRVNAVSVDAAGSVQDVGLHVKGTIGDRVWCDTSLNRQYEPGEGVAGVKTSLYADSDCDGVAEVLRDTYYSQGDGLYFFSGLTVGPAGRAQCHIVAVDVAGMGDCDHPITPVEYHVTLDVNKPYLHDKDFGFWLYQPIYLPLVVQGM